MDLSRIWDICVDKIYDRNRYVQSLDRLLSQEGAKKVLDPACGTGFPALELCALGYSVKCSDGDEVMLRQFDENAKGKLKAKKADWRELVQRYDEEFDAVLVRGNSLIYATSWAKQEISAVESRNAIFESLKNFYQLLRKGGFLYVDLYNENEQPHAKDLGEVALDGKRENWQWKIEHDLSQRVRAWTVIRTNLDTGEQIEHTSYSYLIRHDELIDMLKQVGFSKIDKISLDGEQNYTVYLARK